MDVQTKQGHPPSPARSDESNTERPVREKLKETRIDAQGTSDPAPASDQAMSDALANGTRAEPSTSGSDSERGRLRRKRSREHFEEDEEAKHPEKKHERHVRKKSREVTGFKVLDVESTATPAIAPSGEKNGDEIMRAQEDVEDEVADKCVTVATGVASPKNKRTREQAEDGTEIAAAPSAESKEESTATTKVDEERTTKRPRDAVDTETINGTAKDKTTTSFGSGFANTSSASPFATMSPKPQTSKTTEAAAEDLPKSSDSNFKNSAFGKLAQQPSAFSAAPGTSSPFGASSGKSSWLSKPKPSAPAGIENKTPSIFGGSNTAKPSGFGGSLGATPKLFGPTSTSGTGGGFGGKGFGQGTAITGLKKTEAKPFGSKEVASKSEKSENANDEEGGDKENGDKTEEHNGADRRTSQPLLQSQGPPETGEENEDNVYVGRAKLYTFQDEAGKKSWQERGAGVLKLNMTREEPRKARFVLRADGTHRLLLNAALLATMPFGTGTKPLGKMPEDGRLYFQAPTASGEVESYILRMKAEKAQDLWTIVEGVKQDL